MLSAPLQKILLGTRCIIAACPARQYSLFSFLKGESAGDATVEGNRLAGEAYMVYLRLPSNHAFHFCAVSVVDPRTVLEHEKWKVS